MADELATKARSFRLSTDDVAHLDELQEELRRNSKEVVSLALTHLLATIKRDERVHVKLPDDEEAAGE